MLRAGSGLSRHPSTPIAGRDAAGAALASASLRQADGAIVFATSHHAPSYPMLLSEIAETLGTDRIVGCSAAGVLTEQGEVESEPGVSVLAFAGDGIDTRRLLVRNACGKPGDVAAELALRLGRFTTRREGALLLLVDGKCLTDELLRQITANTARHPIVGGATSADPSGRGGPVFFGDGLDSRAMAGLHISGALRSQIAITQGCRPVGNLHRVTRAEGASVIEIDDRPAYELFTDELGSALSRDPMLTRKSVRIAVPVDEGAKQIARSRYVIRNIVGFDPDRGVVAVSPELSVGASFSFAVREGQGAIHDLTETLDETRRRLGGARPAFGVYVSCSGRGSSLYGFPDLDTAYIQRYLGDFPLVGFFSGAEFAPLANSTRLFLYTGVLLLFFEAQ